MSDGPSVSQLNYNLPRELDLLAAENLKEQMVDFLHQDGDLLLDATNVERISTPCIEVLYAAGTAFNEVDRGFQIDNPSEYFNDALKTLGLGDHFQCWRVS